MFEIVHSFFHHHNRIKQRKIRRKLLYIIPRVTYVGKKQASNKEDGEHSTAYLTHRSYSIRLCNYYTIIYTMLLLCSLKDNYKKITPLSIVVLIV